MGAAEVWKIYLMNYKLINMSNKLKMVAFHITRVCENKCPYCYVGDENRKYHPIFSQIERIIKELANQKVEGILLVGGDPAKYPDLLKITKLAKKLGLSVSILSNTLGFKKSEFEEIVKLIDKFNATILGADAKEHDSETNKDGAYRELIKNIKRLNSFGKKVGIVLNATPRTHNKILQIIQSLIDKEKINIDFLMIQRIIPRGRADKDLEYSLNKSHLKELFIDIEKIDKKYRLKIIFEDPIPLCLIEKRFHKYLSHCRWGYSYGSIDYNGNLSRCGADASYKLGNIFNTQLIDIWENSPTLVSFRSKKWLPEKCVKCNLLKECGCGCSLSRITEKDHESDILIDNI